MPPLVQREPPSFPHSARVRPSATTNAFTEFCQQGGRRILILYVTLAVMLYLRSMRKTSSSIPIVGDAAFASSTASPRTICKTVHFIRHGEATHNRDAELYKDFYQGRHMSPEYHDAPLTDVGLAQAEALYRLVSTHRKEVATSELIVSSTLRRALQTARAAFPHPRPIIASDLCRERIAMYASDKRRPLGDILQEFGDIEFAEVDGEHDHAFENKKEMHPHPYDSEACKDRARRFVSWLVEDRPEQSIVVITHWVFLSHLLKAEGMDNEKKFENAELRSIELCREVN